MYVVNPAMGWFGSPTCELGYVIKNSCNIETPTYDRGNATLHRTYADYLKSKQRRVDHKIVIVGAGPSGLTTAYYLIKAGLSRRNIVILEKTNRVGGQSNSRVIDGYHVEAGTSYLTNHYKCITDIAYKTDVKLANLPSLLYASVTDTKTVPLTIHYTKSIGLFRRFIRTRRKEWLSKGQLYNPTLKDNRLTFRMWLRKYALEELLDDPLYVGAFYAQLYGWADTVSAHNALQWMTPELLYSVISHDTRALPDGFTHLWRKIVDYYDLDIRYNMEVTEVKRRTQATAATDRSSSSSSCSSCTSCLSCTSCSSSPPVEVICRTKDGSTQTFQCDDAFLCSDVSRYTHPLSSAIGEFDHTRVYSCRMRVSKLHPSFRNVAPYYVIDPLQIEKRPLEISTIRNYGTNSDGAHVCAACGYIPNDMSLANVRAQFKTQLKAYGIKEYTLVDDFIWKYNIRYSNDQFKRRVPQMLERSVKVWYNSGALSHWNVESIARHSIRKVMQFLEHNEFSTFFMDNYEARSLYDRLTTQNFVPDQKQRFDWTFDRLEEFLI